MVLIQHLIAAEVILWAGVILGISMIETWAKLRATAANNPADMRRILDTSHNIQWTLFVVILGTMIWDVIGASSTDWTELALTIGAGFILLAQTIWLFIVSNPRFSALIADGEKLPLQARRIYSILEVVKFFLLIILGIFLMQF